jgi:predicted esterase
MKIRKIFSLVIILTAICAYNTVFSAPKTAEKTIIQFPSKDGFNIAGELDIPAGSSVNKKVPVVIFLHSLGGNKTEWRTLPTSVKSLGTATLTLDLRGHGLSILDKKNKKTYWQNFKNQEFSKYSEDVSYAIKYLKENYPEINIDKTALIGSDIGAVTAIMAARNNKTAVKSLVLLSPLSLFKGIDTRIPILEYGAHPILILVSKNDRNSYIDSTELIKYAQGKKILKVYPSGGSGIDLLKFQPDSKNLILNWLKINFIENK